MGYKKEEMKKRKCFKVSKYIEENKGKLYFIGGVIMIAIITPSSNGLLRLFKILEDEQLILIFKCLFAFTFIPAYLKMVIEDYKKEVK